MNKDKEKELLKLRRKFSPRYILTEKLLEVYLFFLLFIAICFATKRVLYAVFIILLLFIVIFLELVFEKRKSNKTVMKFYEDRIEFSGRIFFIRVEKRVLKYDEIKDITFTQGTTFFEKRFQKRFGYGNIYVYPKKGNIITNGMQIELIENINDRVEDIKNIAGDKIG